MLCLLVIRAQTTVTAFQSTRPLQATCPRQRRGGDGVGPLGPVWNTDEPSPLSYSERSRAFRRDYYTHESWIRHRSKERFVGTIIKIFDSGVVRALLDELVVVGGVAAVVISYNALLVTGWDDWGSVHHEPLSWPTQFPLMYLPLTGFTLSSSALSLLLGTWVGLCRYWLETISWMCLCAESHSIMMCVCSSRVLQYSKRILRIKDGTKHEKPGVT